MKAQHSHLGFGVFVAEGDKLVHRLTRLLSGPAIGARASACGRWIGGPSEVCGAFGEFLRGSARGAGGIDGLYDLSGHPGAGRSAATGIVGRPALGPRADEALLVIMPPGRRRFLFEQAGPE